MSHFILSMMLLDAAFALAWCSRYEPWERRRSSDRLGVWAVRALIPLGQLTILAGTIATASGPHAGAHEGELVHRFTFQGGETLEWVVQRHAALAAIYGLAAIGVWLLLRRPGGEGRALRAADRRDRPARPPGPPRRRPVGAGAASRDRLAPRRDRHPQLAGDALDGRRGGTPRAAAKAAPRPAASPTERPRPPRAPSRRPCFPSGSRSAPSASSRRRWSRRPRPATAPFLSGAAQPLLGAGAAALDRRRGRGDRARVGHRRLPHLPRPGRGAAACSAGLGGDRPWRPTALGAPRRAAVRDRLGSRKRLARRRDRGPGALRPRLRQPRLAARLRRPRAMAEAGDLRDGGDRRLADRRRSPAGSQRSPQRGRARRPTTAAVPLLRFRRDGIWRRSSSPPCSAPCWPPTDACS